MMELLSLALLALMLLYVRQRRIAATWKDVATTWKDSCETWRKEAYEWKKLAYESAEITDKAIQTNKRLMSGLSELPVKVITVPGHEIN